MGTIRFRPIFLLLSVLVLSACTLKTTPLQPSPIPTPLLPEGSVTISTGQTVLSGTVYGTGSTAVILATRGGHPASEWSSLAKELSGEGFTALTIPSPDNENAAVTNVRLAIDFLHDHGFDKILCVGASMGASGCAYNASRPELIGIVLITYHGNAILKSSPIPKLFIAAGLDNTYRPLTESGYQEAGKPKTLIIVENSKQLGPSILDAPGLDLHDTLIRFLKGCPDR